MTSNDLELGHVSGQRVTLDLSLLTTAAEERVLRLLLVRALAKEGAARVSQTELIDIGGSRSSQDLALGLAELVLGLEQASGSYGYVPLFFWVGGADGELEVTLNELKDPLRAVLGGALRGGRL